MAMSTGVWTGELSRRAMPLCLKPGDGSCGRSRPPAERGRDRLGVCGERLEAGAHRVAAEARARALQAHDRRELAARAEDRCGDRVQIGLALADRLGVALAPDA